MVGVCVIFTHWRIYQPAHDNSRPSSESLGYNMRRIVQVRSTFEPLVARSQWDGWNARRADWEYKLKLDSLPGIDHGVLFRRFPTSVGSELQIRLFLRHTKIFIENFLPSERWRQCHERTSVMRELCFETMENPLFEPINRRHGIGMNGVFCSEPRE